MTSGEGIRGAQRAAWARLSGGWEAWDAVIMDQLGPVTAALVGRLDVAADQRHLDVAAGTGEPGLTVAGLAPRGQVVLTDLSAEMLGVARRRAAAQGIGNAVLAVASADDLPFPDETFDSVSVRFGFMFFPDLARATGELARVLKPGGRLCASVWAEAAQNPWTTVATRAAAVEVPPPPADPAAPGMFRCAAPGYLPALFDAAGLRAVDEWEVAVELVTSSPQEYWQMISDHVSLVVAALAQTDDAARERIAREVMTAVADYDDGAHVRVPGLARCAVGTKQPEGPA